MINNNWGVRSYWVYPSLTEWIWMVNMGYTPIKHSFGAYKTWGETRKMLCWNTRFFLRGGDAWIQHQVGKQLKQLVHLRIKKPDLDRPRPLTPEAAVASKSLRHLRCVYCCWKINARFVSSILQFFILLMNICNILTVCMKHILLVSRSCPHIMRNPSSFPVI
jgi:hypothetical protein